MPRPNKTRSLPLPRRTGGGKTIAFILAVVIFASACFAADPAPTPDSAISRGLKFLALQRNRDGSFGTDNARLLGTSRALLVFLQAGNVPDSGRYGTAVKEAEEWMTRAILPAGGFAESDGRTRAQAAAVLALAETYGVEANPDRRMHVMAALRLAVGPLLATQFPAQIPPNADAGGWGDEKNAAPTLPLTAIAAVALGSARDVGVSIPDAALDQSRRYILSCHDRASGGFGQQPGKPPGVDSTVTALVTLDVLSPAGDESDVATVATKYLETQAAAPGKSLGFIGAAWVCWCDARLELAPTAKLRDAIIQHLMTIQDADGGWNAGVAKPDATTPTRLAVTELALIGMTAHFRSTPILRH